MFDNFGSMTLTLSGDEKLFVNFSNILFIQFISRVLYHAEIKRDIDVDW